MNLQNIDPDNFVMCPYRYISRSDPCPGKSCRVCEAGEYDAINLNADHPVDLTYPNMGICAEKINLQGCTEECNKVVASG